MRTLVLTDDSSPTEWGRLHGESYRGEIHRLAEVRVWLTAKLGRAFDTEAQVLAVAEAHLPVLERFDRDLYDELMGIAEGAAIDPARLVVLNHYTDLRDLDPSDLEQDGGCSILYTRTDSGSLLGQTWDMHATAIPYTMMMWVPRPGAWVLTLTGCLGMAGLNRHGVGIAINNLHSNDAQVGALWPAIVRRVLSTTTAAEGRDALLASPIGSGHHYLIADERAAYGVETSGRERKQIYAGEPGWYVHTNHCLDDAISALSRVPPTSTTHDRYRLLSDSVAAAPVRDALDLWTRLGSEEEFPRSVCTNMSTPQNPHGVATCAGIVMDLHRRQVLAAGGLIHNVDPEHYDFDR